ncbi:MAG: hypothetical protein EBY21_08180 [Alphaproteobacteria bacterium]|nr:hypothetical protein [Alphaproteobacteria bacterium]
MGDILFYNFKSNEVRKSGTRSKKASAQIIFFPGIRVDRGQLDEEQINASPKATSPRPKKPGRKKQA